MSVSEDTPLPEPHRGLAVVTDSTPYLPWGLIERWGIRQVSLYVGWDGDLKPEHEYEDLDAFYARLRDSRRLPTTSQPSVGDFLACYQPLLAAGRDVLSVHLASGLSGTCESAREAARIVSAEGHAGRVEVLDSQTGAGGLGCMVMELHDRGATDWIVQHAQAAADSERLVEEGVAIFGADPLFCTEVGLVLGAHLGRGMLIGGFTRDFT